MINRKRFFDTLREAWGPLEQKQVHGYDDLLDAWENEARTRHKPPQMLAYCLATAKHETANTIQPVEEIGKGQGKPYGAYDHITGHRYYGRGYVQLTWAANYKKAGQRLGMGHQLYFNPSLAKQPKIAAYILFLGSLEGWFTGKRLDQFLARPGQPDNWVRARSVINGFDKAALIARYALVFHRAIT